MSEIIKIIDERETQNRKIQTNTEKNKEDIAYKFSSNQKEQEKTKSDVHYFKLWWQPFTPYLK